MALKRMDTGRTTVLLTLALLFSAITGSAWSQKTSRTEPSRSAKSQQADSLAEAESLLQKQQYAEAEQKLTALLSDVAGNGQAENPQAWFDLGFAQSHLNKTGEAVASYRKAAGLSPKWFEANLNLGVALAKSNDDAAATPVLQHAVTLKPTAGGNKALSKAWQSLAQVLEKTDANAAAAAYDKAVELDPSQTELTLDAGRALQSSNDLPGAEEHFKKSADSGDAQGMVMLINLLSGQKRYTEAEGWLTKYVAKNPQDSKARLQLGRFLASQGKSQEAIAVLQNQNQPNGQPPGNPEIDRELAELYLQTKQYAQAEPLFRGLSQTSTTDPDLHFGLGVAVLHQLKYAEAEREFIQTVKLKPDYGEAYGYLADAARENKHYELAIRALDARAKFLPEDARSYFIRATSFDNLHMFKPAAENYKKFLAIAAGKFPDQEFQARHRLKAIQPE
jgi:tetratricopeptide (TPR) repeat protein